MDKEHISTLRSEMRDSMLQSILRQGSQTLERGEVDEARVYYDIVATLAMTHGCSDAIVRSIFSMALQLPGFHPELSYFGKRATTEELAQLYQHQQGHVAARSAINKAMHSSREFPPLLE